MPRLKQWVVLGSLLALSFGLNANAATEIKELNDPITVEFQTTLHAEDLKGDEPFTAVLKEDITYNGQTIPAGTTFHGHVGKASESKPFFRKGYLTLLIDKAVFPTGTTYNFDAERFSQNLEKIHAEDNKRSFFKKNLPMSIVSMGTSIPLRVATNLSGFVVTPIAMGARMAYGVVDEVFISDEHKDDSVGARAGQGIYRGTGIPTAVSAFKKAPSPEIDAGETGKLYVNPNWLAGLFKASENLNVLMLESAPDSDK